MKKVSVQAYEDRSRPEGGHAIVLLHGLTEVPDSAAFRIKPVDASHDGTVPGWPIGDQTPVAIRMTDQGLELTVGPEVADSELLLPGIVVEIEMPAAGVCGEFLWPNIAPQLRQRRRSVVINRQRRNGRSELPQKPDARTDEPQTGPVPAAPVTLELPPADTVPDAADVPVEPAASSPGLAVPADTPVLDTVASPPAAAAAPVPRFVSRAAAASLAKAAAANSHAWDVKRDVVSMRSTKFLALGQPDQSSPEIPKSATIAPGASAPITRPQSNPALENPHPMTPQKRADAPAQNTNDASAWYQHARAGRIDPGKPSRAPRRSGSSTIALQAIAGLLAGVAALYVLSRESA